MPELRLFTLGQVRVWRDEQDITALLPVKMIALLVYLARHEHPKPREHLAELFWAQKSASQALGSLRTALSKSRNLLGESLISTHYQVGIRAWCDANVFESALSQNTEDALALYKGEFLPSFFIGDSREFENWQLYQADKLHERFIQATLQYVDQLQARQDIPQAIRQVQHALTIAPLREDLHRLLIQFYQLTHNRAGALKQYETCRSLLWEEYGLEPAPETQALYQQLDKTPLPAMPAYRLPIRTSSFVGRTETLPHLSRLVQHHPLITITATGGVGKTRLALELAYRLQDQFTHGACFIDLSELTHSEQVLSVVAQRLGLTEEDHLAQRIPQFLAQRHLLLLLDNFEQVMEASSFIADWIANAPQLRVIVTSREALKLYGEQVFELSPLSLQESCHLFYERVRTIHAHFNRTGAIDLEVKQICQQLDGLPLAIELTAMRTRTLSLSEILQGLTQKLAWLKSDLRNMPRRQRTLFHTIDWSYKHLTTEQATLFRHCAVFRGGWTAEAIRTISPYADHLDSLIEKHLVRRAFFGTYRYTMLETIREYALYQLNQAGELVHLQQRHAEWACQLAETLEQGLRKPHHGNMLNLLREEQDNLHIALENMAQHPGWIPLYARTLSALGTIWNVIGIAEKPFIHLQRAIEHRDSLPTALQARLLVAGGHSAYTLGNHTLARQWQTQALSLFEALEDVIQQDETRFFMTGHETGSKEVISTLLDLRQRALARQDDYLLSMVNINLGNALLVSGEFSQSLIYLQEGLAVCERNHYFLFTVAYHLNLADAYYAHNQLETAFEQLQRTYDLSTAHENHFLQAYSLLEECKLCAHIGNIQRLKGRIAQVEPLLQWLVLPELWVRFYFWQAFLAEQTADLGKFRWYIQQTLNTLNPTHSNMVEAGVNVLLYVGVVMAKHQQTPQAHLCLTGALFYCDTLNVCLLDYQEQWKATLIQFVDERNLPTPTFRHIPALFEAISAILPIIPPSISPINDRLTID